MEPRFESQTTLPKSSQKRHFKEDSFLIYQLRTFGYVHNARLTFFHVYVTHSFRPDHNDTFSPKIHPVWHFCLFETEVTQS